MADVVRYRHGDRRAVDALYRRVFGIDAAEASRLRWDWQYRRNPNNPGNGPEIWVAREGPALIGQYATMPVQLSVQGTEIQGSWGMDVMVAPERQRQGLGEVLFRTWDRHVGASLGMGLSESSYQLFRKLRWPDVGPVPCFVKPLTRRALRRAELAARPQPAGVRDHLAVREDRRAGTARCAPRSGCCSASTRASRSSGSRSRRSSTWRCVATRPTSNWKYTSAPHVRYSIAALRRDERNVGYAVYRHAVEPRGRADAARRFPHRSRRSGGLHHAARLGGSRGAPRGLRQDPRSMRCTRRYGRTLRKCGYFQVKSTMQLVVKVNALEVPSTFYDETGKLAHHSRRLGSGSVK